LRLTFCWLHRYVHKRHTAQWQIIVSTELKSICPLDIQNTQLHHPKLQSHLMALVGEEKLMDMYTQQRVQLSF
jgi:hypothetical protein